MGKKLSHIASHLGGVIIGDGNVEITGVAGIDEAAEGDITFVANPKYRSRIASTKASAILVSPDIDRAEQPLVVVDDPYLSLAKLLHFLFPDEGIVAGISDRAWIAEDASIGENVTVHPGVFVGGGACLEKGVTLHPGVYVGPGAVIGEDSILHPNVVVYRRCIVGRRVVLHAGVVVGGDGFGFANPGAANVKIPQVGIVQIDDDCEIGANTTIDRGTLGKTWIKRGVKIDNLVQIGHNVVVGENSIIVAQVGISGSTKIGDAVLLGGQAGLVGHISVGDGAMVAARSGIHKDVLPGSIISGAPQMPHREWLRTQVTLPMLPEMRKTLLQLARRVDELERMSAEKKKE